MTDIDELWSEAHEALAKVWFVQSVEEIDRTDHTLSLRLWIRADLFVDVFLGELSGSLYMALIHGQRRVFGIDRESGEWHLHPFRQPASPRAAGRRFRAKTTAEISRSG